MLNNTKKFSNNLDSSLIKKIGALTSKPYAFTARPWELRSVIAFDLFDAAASNIRVDLKSNSIARVVPHINERLNENWISDKIRFSYDGFRRQRIVSPLLNNLSISWPSLFSLLKGNSSSIESNLFLPLVNSLPSKISLNFYIGPFSDLYLRRSIVSLFSRLSHFGGTYSFAQFSNAYLDFRSDFTLADLFSKSLADLDLCLFVGCNPRLESPVLNLRVRKLRQSGSLKVGLLGFFSNVTYRTYNFGGNLSSIVSFLEGRNNASYLLSRSRRSLLIAGYSIYNFSKLVVYFRSSKFLRKLNSQFTLLPATISCSSFCEEGLPTNLFSNISYSSSRVDWFLGTDDQFPNPHNSPHLSIYQGHHGSDSLKNFDLILPTSTFFEQESDYRNLLARSIVAPFVHNPPALVRVNHRVIDNLLNFFAPLTSFNSTKVVSSYEVGEFNLRDVFPFSLPFYSSFDRTHLSNNLHDFYLSNPISKNSLNMAIASSRFRKFKSNFNY